MAMVPDNEGSFRVDILNLGGRKVYTFEGELSPDTTIQQAGTVNALSEFINVHLS